MSNKQAIVQSSIEAVEIIDTPIPTPGDKDVVVKVIVAGSNPKDWKYPAWKDFPHNSGDDLAGIVHSVGKDVFEFKPGDRVAAYHRTGGEHGAFAEYSVAPDWTTFHLPPHVSFEEGATIPLVALTAIVLLYHDMGLPPPYKLIKSPADGGGKVPLVIYGITSAVGAFGAKLARLSGLSPIIGIAGRAGDFARTLADYVVDYRQGEDAVVAEVESILVEEGLGSKARYVLDAISEGGTIETSVRFLDPNGGTICNALPPQVFAKDKNFKFPPGVKAYNSGVVEVHTSDAANRDFGYLWSRYLGRLLAEWRLKGHPYEVVPGGLRGVLKGLQSLRDGKASGLKYVFRIEETGMIPSFPFRVGRPASEEETGQKASHPMQDFPFPEAV